MNLSFPYFAESHFATGVGADSLALATSLVFNSEDELQWRWGRRLVKLLRHTLPSSHAFSAASVAGFGGVSTNANW